MHKGIAAAAPLLVAATAAFSNAGNGAAGEVTPLSCDGKPVAFHVDRAKELARHSYRLERILDAEPQRREEQRAFAAHRKCVRDAERRRHLRHYLAAQREEFEAHFASLTNPPGDGWLSSTRYCESGGNYYIDTGSGYAGAYQFDSTAWAITAGPFKRATGLQPNPSRLALPREQDIRASLLYRMVGPGAWPVCGF